MNQTRDELVYIKNILRASNPQGIDFSLLENVFTAFEHEPTFKANIFDSFSRNQFLAKTSLVDGLDKLNLITPQSEVVIWGCWYGSMLIPLLHDKVRKITAIDFDDNAITIGKNRLFEEYFKVDWITADLFEEYKECYNTADIFINTSCEHMLPMKWWGPKGPRALYNHFHEWDGKYHDDWPVYDEAWWDRVKPGAHFAFTSNNMRFIPYHINCIDSIEEFKLQLPPGAEVLAEDELEDERGTRYLLIGKL